MTLTDLARACEAATPGPWAYSHIGQKTNGYIVGTAFNEKGEPLSGFIDDDLLMDEVMLRVGQQVGEYEAATCDYANATFIALSRSALPKLLAFVQAWDELQKHYVNHVKTTGWIIDIRAFWDVNNALLKKVEAARKALEE